MKYILDLRKNGLLQKKKKNSFKKKRRKKLALNRNLSNRRNLKKFSKEIENNGRNDFMKNYDNDKM